jgi:5-oxoprolinase (ATP-hydrolysing)/N-methylhydantoinase A
MRDLIELGMEQRYDVHDLFLKFPPPLVARYRRLEIAERLSRDGEILVSLDEAAVRGAVEALAADGVEALAICFLHSYRDPRHEQRAAAIAREAHPQLAISVSSEVVPEVREYPRFVTTCANAYVQPLMDRYIQRLEHELYTAGFRGVLRLMHSAGGLVSPDTARRFPIRLLESGPAGGGLATAWFGSIAGKPEIISFDMGGTTAKACLIEGGRPEIANGMEAAREHRFKRGSGLPIRAPVIEMIEIGAGGGSIAALDDVGLLRVGPHSAGADPGPACYARGGVEPTVTDANLLLGYYDPNYFLGGRMQLDVPAAEAAMARIAEPLRLGSSDAAWGVHRLVTESMAAAARLHVVERGRDPRRYAMVAFGGAGPAHAAEVARLLGVTEVLIPPASGAASALGFLAAPLSFEQSLSLPVRLRPGFNAAQVNDALRDLEAKARALVGNTEVRVERSAEMRLAGQMQEIAVPLPDGLLGDEALDAIRAEFATVYKARFTSLYESAEIEVISFRVRCGGPLPQLTLRQPDEAGVAAARKGERDARFAAGFVAAAVYDRYALRAGDAIPGPAMIEEREATTVVPPGDIATVDASGMLRIDVAAQRQAAMMAAADLDAEIRRIETDPIALEIMWSRLVQVTQEMWGTVVRTAFSLTMCESQDFACDLLDASGEALAHSPQAMPVFNLTLPRVAKAILQVYPPETLRLGDVLITNDPWLCVEHLFDLAVVTPVFRGGKLVALTGTIGHVTDIGGTLDPLRARDVYEEGLQILPIIAPASPTTTCCA